MPEAQATGAPAPSAANYTIATGPDYTEGGATSGVIGASATKTAGVSEATTTTTTTSGANSSSGAPQLADPTAGVAALSMEDKSKGLSAPESSQAKPLDSRDVSPMSKPNPSEQTAPVVTTGE